MKYDVIRSYWPAPIYDTPLPAGVYGSMRAFNFIRETTTKGLDVAIVGDSNTGYNAPNDGGYVQGISYGLDVAFPSNAYATATFTLMNEGNSAGYKCSMQGASLASAPGGYVSGKASGDAGIKTFFDRGSGSWSDAGGANAGTYTDFPWLESGNQTENINRGMTIDSDHPIGVNNALRYRVLRSQTTTGGSFYMRVRLNGGSYAPIATSASIPCSGATNLVASELPITVGTRNLSLASFWSIQNAVGLYTVGPWGGLLQSMYRPTVGWAVDAMYFMGGATITAIDTDFAAANTAGYLTATMLAEYYNRQLAAGGDGRIVVWIQGGANQSDWTSSPSTWPAKWESIMNYVRTAATYAAIPSEKLAFVAMCTHDITGYDFASRRAALIALTTANPDLTVVNIPEIIPFASYSAYASGAHLSKTGYQTIGNAIIQRMLS
jgi:hypothetical protein